MILQSPTEETRDTSSGQAKDAKLNQLKLMTKKPITTLSMETVNSNMNSRELRKTTRSELNVSAKNPHHMYVKNQNIKSHLPLQAQPAAQLPQWEPSITLKEIAPPIISLPKDNSVSSPVLKSMESPSPELQTH